MAGIGFELKRLFSKKGLFSLIRSYGYAGVVCTGPMLLGMVLLFGIRMMAGMAGVGTEDQEFLNCMITYTSLISVLVTNSLSMLTTRYVADMLYINKYDRVMPSFYGSVAIMFAFGGILYGTFLFLSRIEIEYQLCCIILFMELVVVWTEIIYLTAVKDYMGILKTFAVATVGALMFGGLLVYIGRLPILSLFIAVIIGYGIMLVWYYKLLIEYFPKGMTSSMSYLKWIDKYWQLLGIGTFMSIGLFSHLLIRWLSPLGVRVRGLFFSSPEYDLPALFAFISIILTNINFVTSVEVNFYPKYKIYFDLFNGSVK